MFCAICTSERGPFELRPLGRNDALVRVCAACDEEPIVARQGRDYAYESDEGMSQDETNARLTAFSRETKTEGCFHTFSPRAVTAGFILVRVPTRDPRGKRRDAREAARTIAHEPWFGETHYVGHAGEFVLFERPDPAVLAAARAPNTNPLAAIEIYRVDGAA